MSRVFGSLIYFKLEFKASVTRFTKTNLHDDDDENDAVRANQPTARSSIYITIVLFINGISNSAGVFIGEN